MEVPYTILYFFYNKGFFKACTYVNTHKCTCIVTTVTFKSNLQKTNYKEDEDHKNLSVLLFKTVNNF